MRRIPVAPLVKFLSLAVVVALATTVLGLTIANSQAGATATYQARFADASGLLRDDEVRIAGVIVGRVSDVRVVDRDQAEVRFTVADGQPVPASARAAINYRNLIGQRYLELEAGPGPIGELLAPGSTIPLERTTGPLNLTVLFNGFKPLFRGLDPEQVNKLSLEIVQTLQGQGGTVRSLLASTSSLANTVADRDQVVGEVVSNLNDVLTTVNEGDQRVGELVSSLQALVSGLSGDRETIGDAIVSINDLTRTTAGFIAEARDPLKDDIAALGDLAGNLDRNSETVDEFLRLMPRKLNAIGRASSFASWFNFYLCDIEPGSLRLTVPTAGGGSQVEKIDLPHLPIGSRSRCQADPDQDGITDVDDLPRSAAASMAPLRSMSDLRDDAADPATAGLPLVGG